MQYRITALTLAGAALAVAACGSDKNNSTNPQPQFAQVRFVNAASGVNGSVNAFNGSSAIAGAGSLAFQGATTGCINVPVGSQSLSFRSGSGSTLATTTANLTANQKLTVVLMGTGATPTISVLNDNALAATSGNNMLRFINGTGTAGDIFVTTPGGTLNSPSVNNLAAGGVSSFGSGTTASAFSSFPVGNTSVQLFDVGTSSGTPRASFTLPSTLTGSRVGTVVLTNAATSGGATGFLVNGC